MKTYEVLSIDFSVEILIAITTEICSYATITGEIITQERIIAKVSDLS